MACLPIADVTLNTNVQSVLGSDSESGTATLSAKGTSESRVDLSVSGGTRSDVRYLVSGYPAGAWSKNSAPSTPYSGQNCWTDAAWFFPALSSLTQNPIPISSSSTRPGTARRREHSTHPHFSNRSAGPDWCGSASQCDGLLFRRNFQSALGAGS